LPKVKIPDDLLEYFRDEEQGIDKISDFLKLHPELMPVFIIQPKTTTYPTHIFQGGKAVYEVIAATAGTVTTSISPPAGKRWLWIGGQIILVADATAITRNFVNVIEYNGSEWQRWGNSANITASQTKIHSYERTVEGDSTTAATNRVSGKSIGDLILDEDDTLKISVKNGQAGDSYSGIFKFLEVDV